MIKIYHNPRCQKSRQTLKILEESGKDVEVVEYLKTPPDAIEIRDVVEKLGVPVTYIIRKGEKVFKEEFKGKDIPEDDWFSILAENPILIERPIVVKGEKAVVGRPPENVEKLL